MVTIYRQRYTPEGWVSLRPVRKFGDNRNPETVYREDQHRYESRAYGGSGCLNIGDTLITRITTDLGSGAWGPQVLEWKR